MRLALWGNGSRPMVKGPRQGWYSQAVADRTLASSVIATTAYIVRLFGVWFVSTRCWLRLYKLQPTGEAKMMVRLQNDG